MATRATSVCVLGGTGFVGSRLVTRLVDEGYRVRVLTRNREAHRDLLVLPDLDLTTADVHDPGQLAAQFASFDIVVNLIGILNERGWSGAGFRRAHTELAGKVVRACRSSGVKRLLHMSSLGADAENAPSHYLRTKGEAEAAVRAGAAEGGIDWTIFRPSVIFGPGDSFTNRFARLLRRVPLMLPLARSGARFAPVYVDDVVEAMLRSLQIHGGAGRTFELCGPKSYSLGEIVRFLARTLSLRRWVFGLPDILGRLQALVMDFIPGKPFSTDNYRSLLVDSICREDGFGALGIAAHSMEAIVRQYLGAQSAHGLLDTYRHHSGRN
ncbi:MAG TPA: complex I NDUFA9 subunit family protein [Steroidobacteraceae bacterium]